MPSSPSCPLPLPVQVPPDDPFQGHRLPRPGGGIGVVLQHLPGPAGVQGEVEAPQDERLVRGLPAQQLQRHPGEAKALQGPGVPLQGPHRLVHDGGEALRQGHQGGVLLRLQDHRVERGVGLAVEPEVGQGHLPHGVQHEGLPARSRVRGAGPAPQGAHGPACRARRAAGPPGLAGPGLGRPEASPRGAGEQVERDARPGQPLGVVLQAGGNAALGPAQMACPTPHPRSRWGGGKR